MKVKEIELKKADDGVKDDDVNASDSPSASPKPEDEGTEEVVFEIDLDDDSDEDDTSSADEIAADNDDGKADDDDTVNAGDPGSITLSVEDYETKLEEARVEGAEAAAKAVSEGAEDAVDGK